MKKVILALSLFALTLSSCGTKKKIAALEAQNKECQDLLNSTTVKLNLCLSEKEALSKQNDYLKQNNSDLINSSKEITLLSTKGAQNLEKSLESLKEKDLKITRLQDALTKKDSVTLALVTSLKSSVGITDPDIEINVEKGVVYVSISDKLLFNSGSFTVTTRARNVLEKIAKVISDKPDLEFMVEGHTDNLLIDQEKASETIPGIVDNWDLSVKRATSVVRILQNDYGVDPTKLVAAGRSFHMPIADNDSSVTRARNRRTRIIVLPKLDQFANLIEEGMSMNVFLPSILGFFPR